MSPAASASLTRICCSMRHCDTLPMLRVVMPRWEGNSSSYTSFPTHSIASWDELLGSKPGAQKQTAGSCNASGNAMMAGSMPNILLHDAS